MKRMNLGAGVAIHHDGREMVFEHGGARLMGLCITVEQYEEWVHPSAAGRMLPQFRRWVAEDMAGRMYCSEKEPVQHRAYAEGYAAAMEIS